MNAEELRAIQAPLKARYKENPAAAKATLRARVSLGSPGISCSLDSHREFSSAGLHPMAGGDASEACSADMLLESLAACAGVTLKAVATALGINLRGGTVTAEGDLDFLGTLGVSKEVPVGFQSIRVQFALDTDASPDQLASLIKLAERYCVIYQTLRQPANLTTAIQILGK
jgi:uncharacterized OsmC-like protein